MSHSRRRNRVHRHAEPGGDPATGGTGGLVHPGFSTAKLDDLDWSGIIKEVNGKIQIRRLLAVRYILHDDGVQRHSGKSGRSCTKLRHAKGALDQVAPGCGQDERLSYPFSCLPVRYAMIMGFTVLALLHYDKLDIRSATGIDFEKILPAAILQFVPAGLDGACYWRACWLRSWAPSPVRSTRLRPTSSTIFTSKYIEPKASNRRICQHELPGSGLTGRPVWGCSWGCSRSDVNSILQWIVSALYGGYVAANVLKWHWWRFNASGFFWGMLAGYRTGPDFAFRI